MPETQPILELGTEHADGTYYVDGEGDIWNATPYGWVVTRWTPFIGPVSQIEAPGIQYGPYRPVLGPDGGKLP